MKSCRGASASACPQSPGSGRGRWSPLGRAGAVIANESSSSSRAAAAVQRQRPSFPASCGRGELASRFFIHHPRLPRNQSFAQHRNPSPPFSCRCACPSLSAPFCAPTHHLVDLFLSLLAAVVALSDVFAVVLARRPDFPRPCAAYVISTAAGPPEALLVQPPRSFPRPRSWFPVPRPPALAIAITTTAHHRTHTVVRFWPPLISRSLTLASLLLETPSSSALGLVSPLSTSVNSVYPSTAYLT